MQQSFTIDTQNTDGHACFLYKDAQERIDVLATYFQQGIVNNELCIFVTAESADEAIEQLAAAGFDASEAVANKSLRIFEMIPTYLGNGQFIAEYMLNNVQGFIADATANGYSGLRTAGEMSWLNDHPEAVEDAVAYERSVNLLNTPDSSFTGLCLYPVQDSFTQVLNGAMQTHPSVIRDHQVRLNPQYELA